MEQPEEFVEALRKASEDQTPFRLEFGPRIIGYNVLFNFADTDWGNPSSKSKSIRQLNRNLNFREAVTQGIDRVRLGNSLVRGPFTAVYAGGIVPETSFGDRDSVVFYPYSIDSAKGLLKKAGLVDSDGDGFVNFPSGTQGGANVEIAMLVNGNYGTDRSLDEGVIQMMEQIGLRVVADIADANRSDNLRTSGEYDWILRRVDRELVSVVQNSASLAATGDKTLQWYMAGSSGDLNLLPFEKVLADITTRFISENDPGRKADLIREHQKVYTENVYSVGLVTYPGALIINKRIRNVASGTPILLYQWAEDSAVRERMYVPKDLQQNYELYPETLPIL